MTTVEFGGGPTLEARRRFANLKEGSEVPKYGGHIHQLRFRQGHTYGDETHNLSKEFPQLRRTKSEIVKIDQSDPYVSREFPDGLIPGYAGYVPQRKFQHGDRYRIETDACKTTTKTAYEKGRQTTRELERTISAYPKTRPLNSGTVLKHFLDYHRAYHPNEISQRSDRRTFLEGPIPGYQGYIPRMSPIGVGLGSTYKQAARKALNRFGIETSNSMTNLPATADVPDYTNKANFTKSLMDFAQARPSTTNRLYKPSGMVPKYTGYLPQRKYRCGQTFGDTTRDLPICAQSSANFGDFSQSNSFIQSSTTNFH